MSVKQRSRPGRFESFEKRYSPVYKDETMLRELDDSEVHLSDPKRVWTVLDCDGKLILSPGFCYVNRFGYVLCEKPWPEAEADNTGYYY